MKRILLLLGLGLVIINVTNGCNKSDDTSATSTTPAVTSTNSASTNVPPPAH